MTHLYEVPGLFNLRDLGGYTTPEGTVRTGCLLRSDALSAIGGEGREKLKALGLRTAIDLREEDEKQYFPVDLEATGIELLDRPLVGQRVTKDYYELNRFNAWILAERSGQIVGVFELLCRDQLLPVVVFCGSGKDRTGIVSALILSALGVGDDDVCDDYALTQKLMTEEHLQMHIDHNLRHKDISEAMTRSAFNSPREVMVTALGSLRSDYGSASQYLIDSGLSADALEGLKARMVAS